jgi:hypothetical protein
MFFLPETLVYSHIQTVEIRGNKKVRHAFVLVPEGACKGSPSGHSG